MTKLGAPYVVMARDRLVQTVNSLTAEALPV